MEMWHRWETKEREKAQELRAEFFFISPLQMPPRFTIFPNIPSPQLALWGWGHFYENIENIRVFREIKTNPESIPFQRQKTIHTHCLCLCLCLCLVWFRAKERHGCFAHLFIRLHALFNHAFCTIFFSPYEQLGSTGLHLKILVSKERIAHVVDFLSWFSFELFFTFHC